MKKIIAFGIIATLVFFVNACFKPAIYAPVPVLSPYIEFNIYNSSNSKSLPVANVILQRTSDGTTYNQTCSIPIGSSANVCVYFPTDVTETSDTFNVMIASGKDAGFNSYQDIWSSVKLSLDFTDYVSISTTAATLNSVSANTVGF